MRNLNRPGASLGPAAAEFAEKLCGIDLFPWQRWLLDHALELLPDGSLRFRTVVVLVARQQGKSTLSQILALYFMYVLGNDLVLGTAQDLPTAEDVWAGAVEIVDDSPELRKLRQRVVLNSGRKEMILKSGSTYRAKASNRRAGRGLSADLILLDELREHQSWDSWGALTKATIARPEAQIWALSNAGDATSIVLRYLRKKAHAALGDPDGINKDESPSELLDAGAEGVEVDEDDGNDSLAIFEWSAPPGARTGDRDAWAQANPGLGHGWVTERSLAAAHSTDPEWIFRTEVLCQWSDGSLEGPFPPGAWEASADAGSKRAPDAPVALCVETAWDRAMTFIGLASTRPDGVPFVELVAQRAGADWVADWLTSWERSDAVKSAPVAIQAKGAPASSLIETLTEAGVQVVEWGGADLANGTANFYDRVRCAVGEGSFDTGLRHRNDPVLNMSAATTVPRLTDGGALLWDRKRSQSASPLIAVTGALWCLTSGMPEPVKPSVYESRGLVSL